MSTLHWKTADRRLTTRLAIVLATLLLSLLPASAQQKPSIAIVMDGSGSMWGKLPGSSDPKFETVSQFLVDTFTDLSTKPRVGVVLFGQQSRGGCSASTVLREPVAYDEANFVAALERLNPKGRGPLVLGLQQAAQSLSKAPSPRSIIVIHDDPDNCDRDICTATESLKLSFPDLRIFAVTLRPKTANKGALNCVARKTGGQVFEINNAREAKAAIRSAIFSASQSAGTITQPQRQSRPTASVTEPTRPLKPARRSRAVPPTPGLILTAALRKDGPPLQTGLAWKISSLTDNSEKVVHRTTRAQPSIQLSPGRYAVELHSTGVNKRLEVTVERGARTQLNVPLDAAAIQLAAILAEGGALVEDANFEISKVGGSPSEETLAWTGLAPQTPLLLPPGNYKLIASAGRARQVHGFKAIAGTKTNINVPLQAGYLHVKTLVAGDKSAISTIVTIETDDPSQSNGRRIVARSARPNPNFLLAAGTYYVSADNGHARSQELVAIAAGKLVQRKLTVPVMQLRIVAKLRGSKQQLDRGIRYRIWPLRAQSTPPLASSAASPEFELSPGPYRVESRVDRQNAVIVRDFKVSTARTGRITLEFDAGTVALRVNNNKSHLVFWEIKDNNGKTVWRTMEQAPRMTLKSGRYTVIADIASQQTRGEIVVESGQHIDIELGRN